MRKMRRKRLFTIRTLQDSYYDENQDLIVNVFNQHCIYSEDEAHLYLEILNKQGIEGDIKEISVSIK